MTRDTLNYYTSIHHRWISYFRLSTNHRKKNPSSSFLLFPPCISNFSFSFIRDVTFLRVSSFLIFRWFDPRALSTGDAGETRPWKRDRTRDKGVPRKNCDFQGSDVALYHGNGPFSFETDVPTLSPEFLNPMPAIMDRAKTPTPSCRRRKSERKRELYLFYSVSTRVHPKDGRLLYRRTRKIFFFLISFEERKELMEGMGKSSWKSFGNGLISNF